MNRNYEYEVTAEMSLLAFLLRMGVVVTFLIGIGWVAFRASLFWYELPTAHAVVDCRKAEAVPARIGSLWHCVRVVRIVEPAK